MAGLGCVGRNNLFIAPKHGPRIRLRAMGMDINLASSGMIEFDPCVDCDEPCRKVCPQDALSEPWLGDLKGPSHLPARDGSYDRRRCIVQMQVDIDEHRMISVPDSDQPSKQVRYCRRCEIACVAERRPIASS
jgi:epoxyqueuosine reductase